MHSQSLQNAGLKLHCYVSDFPRQVVKRLTILPSPGGVRNKGLTTQKREFDLHSHSFQDQELKFHRNVEDSTRKVVYGLMILPYLRRGQTWRVNLITQKTWIRRAFAQFSRLTVETSQERRRHSGTGRGRVDDSTVSSEGSVMKS